MPATKDCPVDLDEALDRTGGDREFYGELLELFVNEMPEALSRIATGIETGDRDAVLRAAHSLKGAAANLAARNVRDAALELEDAAREERGGELGELLGRVEAELEDLGRFVREFR